MRICREKILGVAIGTIIGALTILMPIMLWAQSGGGNSAASTPGAVINSNSDCRVALKPFIAKEEKSFREFVDQTLKNKSDTSFLVETLTEKYREFRKKLMGELDKIAPVPTADVAVTLEQVLQCKEMVDNSLATVEALVRQSVINNAQAKKTTKLVKKFKDLNTKLGELQREIGTLKGYNDAFRSKLPCFTSMCVR